MHQIGKNNVTWAAWLATCSPVASVSCLLKKKKDHNTLKSTGSPHTKLKCASEKPLSGGPCSPSSCHRIPAWVGTTSPSMWRTRCIIMSIPANTEFLAVVVIIHEHRTCLKRTRIESKVNQKSICCHNLKINWRKWRFNVGYLIKVGACTLGKCKNSKGANSNLNTCG